MGRLGNLWVRGLVVGLMVNGVAGRNTRCMRGCFVVQGFETSLGMPPSGQGFYLRTVPALPGLECSRSCWDSVVSCRVSAPYAGMSRGVVFQI